MKTLLLLFLSVLLCFNHTLLAQSSAKELVFDIQVSLSSDDPSITLNWNTQTGVTSYTILKKNRYSKTFTTLAINDGVGNTQFVDYNISIGEAYEYCVQATDNVNISGYVYAGIELPEVHQAGEILLVIDDTYQLSAATEIRAYIIDLIKEGWKVSTQYVSRTQSVVSVKNAIVEKYNQNPTSLKGVILLGHVPVPYSGKLAPDAHSDHVGAWPSDMYYGDINTVSNSWTDISLNTITATDTRNHNIIGDGKFDVNNKANIDAVKLFVGRIDVYNMPAINANDLLLFKQYLNKNHQYRSGVKKYRQAGIVDDNFGYFTGEAFAQNGWRNFSSLLGGSNVTAGDYITSTKANSYLWSYACGPGWYTGSQGVGTTNDFTSDKMQSVFTMLYGSYFGDWDNQNNFLRAPIASPSASLVSVWGGRPNWFFHTMAMGEPIGYSYINSVDNANTYFPKGYYSNKIHQSLQGDPTLKMYMFEAPTNVLTNSFDFAPSIKVSWYASNDPNVLGYYVYRANDLDGEFVLLNSLYITALEYLDESAEANIQAVYMVKAVKLEQSNTGTFYNLSPGATSLEAPTATVLPVTIVSFSGQINTDKTNTLYWDVKDEKNVSAYDVERSTNGIDFEKIGTVTAQTTMSTEKSYSFIDENPALKSSYRLRSVDIDAHYAFSNIITLHRKATTADVLAYPSPFTNVLNVVYTSESNANLNIQLLDINGRVVAFTQADILAGQTTLQLGSLAKLAKGLYIIVVDDAENRERKMFKVLKE